MKNTPPQPVKFICGFIYPREDIYSQTKAVLEKKFGQIDFQSEQIDFDFTDYYYPEMGKPLFRRFISFGKLQKSESFIKIKSFCMEVEKKYATGKKRKINIDPGYLNVAKLVLTTTKDFSHRIHLGKSIYAEVTLYYSNKQFCEFPTTFPDYRTPLYKNIFEQIRDIYRKQISHKK